MIVHVTAPNGVTYRSYTPATQDEYMRLAAHEFGHILGIDGAYPGGGNRPDVSINPNAIVTANDLMYYDKAGMALSSWDIAMALQAFTESKWQHWASYDTYTQSVIHDINRWTT